MGNFTMWVIALLVGVVAIEGLPMESRDMQDDDLFGSIDENGDGFTSKTELENFGFSWGTSAVFDLNNDGKLSRTEFNIMLFMSNAGVKETNCFNHFRAADLNHDGLISDRELESRMTRLGKAALPIFEEGVGSLGMARQIIQAVDKNHDGKLDYFEFTKVGFEVCQNEWPSSVHV